MSSFSLTRLQTSGINEFLIPFMLVTGITYGVLTYVKTQVEKPDPKKPDKKSKFIFNNRIISFISAIIGLFAANDRDLRNTLFDWIPLLVGVLIIIFFILLIMKFFYDKEEDEKKKQDYLPLLVLLVLILSIVNAYGISKLTKTFGGAAENIYWGAGIAIFILIILFSYKLARQSDSSPTTASGSGSGGH